MPDTMPAAFPKISKIRYEGPKSKEPLAFKHYNPDEIVEGKPMKDHLRFSVVYWHTMRGAGADMFGWGTALLPASPGRIWSRISGEARFVGLRFRYSTAAKRPTAESASRGRSTGAVAGSGEIVVPAEGWAAAAG